MGVEEISILVNERPLLISPEMTVGELRDQFKPDADILIVNGFPSSAKTTVKNDDAIVLIKRGQIPDADELEALMAARHTPGVHECMKKASVGVAGLGGLGSNVAISLARMGIGKLILADFDSVEPSNLNRQQYDISHIGMTKTHAMTRILNGINPYLSITAHNVVLDQENIPSFFQTADIAVECLDSADTKAMFIQTVAKFLPETYVIGASGVAGYGASNTIQTIKLGDKIFMVGDLVTAAEPGRGLMAPRVAIAANHQANLAVSLLIGNGENVDL